MSSLGAKARFSKLGGTTGETTVVTTSDAGGADGSFGKLPSFRYDPVSFIQASKITTGTYAGGYRVAPFGYLNVYFACLGLYYAIEEVGTDARDFVNMVLANLVVANDGLRGNFTIYDVENLDTTPTLKDPDSNDSYASVLNMLAYAYAATYNDWAWYATKIASLKDIMYWNVAQSQKGAGAGNGMIRTFKTSSWGPYYNICLTEDNSECYAGLNCLVLGLTQLADADAAYYTSVRDGVGAGMNNITYGVWDETNQRWYTSDGHDTWTGSFYADAVTQVFPQVYGVKSGDALTDTQRYDAGWATLEATSPQWYSGAYDDFPWMILGYAAALRGSLYEAQLQMAYTVQKKVNNTGTMPINDSGLYYATLKKVRGIGSALSVAAQARIAVVVDSIADADTDHAPSRNAVFDALALKAPLLSPALTGTPSTPSSNHGTNSTQIANTAFTRTLFGAQTTAGTADWNDVSNTIPGTGYTLLTGAATNGPGGSSYYHAVNFEYSTKSGAGNLAQLAIPHGNVAGAGLKYRNRYSGVFGSWYTIWDSNNDGAGSGLDADLLDGQQGTYFLDLANATGTLANARLAGIYTGASLALGNGKAAWDGVGATARATTHAASYRSAVSNATGAIVFYMPWTSSLMMNVRIVGYLYAPAQSIDIVVKAYKSSTVSAWTIPLVHSTGTFTPTVQLGMTAAGEVAIILGDVASVWSYPHLSMMFTQTSHTGGTDASATGWLSALVTDLSLYTNLLTPVITPLGASISGSAAQTLGRPSSGSTSAVANVSSNLAQYTAIGAATGAIVFNAPTNLTSVMLRASLKGHIYNTANAIVDLEIVTYRGPTTWNSTYKSSKGIYDPRVRLAINPSGNACIIVEDIATVWNNPHFTLDGAFHYSSATDALAAGWTVALVTDLSAYTYMSADVAASPLASAISGSAPTLTTPRNINGVSFNGSANITIAASTTATLTFGLGFTADTFDGSVAKTATMGTPSTVSSASSNTVSAGTHTHALTVTKTDVGLAAVENTALSTWVGSANLTTVGTIATGTWSGTAIADNKIAAILTGKTYNGLIPTAVAVGFTIAGGTTSKTLTVPLDASVSGTNTGDQTTITGNAGSATKLLTARTFNLSGKASGTATAFDGQTDVVIPITTVTLLAADIPALDWSKISTGKPTTLAGYGITDSAVYATGVFTPTVVGNTTAGTGTYTKQFGKYTKIGNLVTFKLTVAITAHTGTGDLRISGLPFTSANDSHFASLTIGYVNNLALTAGNIPTAIVGANGAQVILYQTPTGGGAGAVVPIDVAFEIQISGSYFVP